MNSTNQNLGFPKISDGVQERVDRLSRMGLSRHVFELEALGYTIVPDVLTTAQVESLGADLRRVSEIDEGIAVDMVGGASHRDRTHEAKLLYARGSAEMRDLVAHPVTLELIRYLLGEGAVLSSFTGYVKGPGKCALGVHSDTAYVPDPVPPYAQLANVNILLSDYTVENGCLTMVPGSHRYGFRPREGQGTDEQVPVIAPAGSAVVFHGNTWHSATQRSAPGVRLTLSVLYSRMYMRTQEDYRQILTPEDIQGMSEQHRSLVLPDLPTGWASLEHAKEVDSVRKTRSRQLYSTRGQHV